jgi:hypothetical protein
MNAPAIEPVLRVGQLIPPLAARAPDGTRIAAWDYRQKRNLSIAFMHAECAACAGYIERLARRAADFAERDAVVLVVLPTCLCPEVFCPRLCCWPPIPPATPRFYISVGTLRTQVCPAQSVCF